MPTELIKTTRMRAVLQTDVQPTQRSSGVVPCTTREPQSPARTTSEIWPAPPEPAAAEVTTTGTQRQRGTSVELALAQMDSGGALPQEEAANLPQSKLAAVSTPTALDCGETRALEALARAQRERAVALQQALTSQQQARAAELRALRAEQSLLAEQSLWADQSLLQPVDERVPQHFEPAPRNRRRLQKAALAGLLGLAIGGYLCLLFPLRKHIAAQHDAIRELEVLSQRLREENNALRVRLRGLKQEPSTHSEPARP